jgi:hypothetical protein
MQIEDLHGNVKESLDDMFHGNVKENLDDMFHGNARYVTSGSKHNIMN